MMRKFAFLAAGAVLGALATGSVAEFGGLNGATAAAPTPTGSSIFSATCSSASAPTTSRSRMTRS